ncbi:MAG: hypothetical protein HN919_10340 [Verrucomicrobia bacterium]|jgi:uncharacterized membrane protein YbhN (UPF0104 family)|nr:hypothetical protein [Verrucomicrobiota bacterium]MBT7066691.1 hypothetical protein [Verrucomicrobiota bacterium]MBT7701364.1 hypothetical protein [Verrucomicrobiota bacterium]
METRPIESDPKRERLRRIVYLGFSLVLTVAVFAYLFSHISLRDVIDLILHSNRKSLALFVVLSLLMSGMRTWRYKIVLKVSGHCPSSVALYLVVLVRNFFSDLLPARLGTLIYVYVVTHRLGVPFGAAAASFALSFLFDIIALVPMLLLAGLCSAAVVEVPAWLLLGGGGVVAVVAIGFLFALVPLLGVGRRLLGWVVTASGGRGARLLEMWTKAEVEIRRARAAGLYLPLLLLSVGVRFLKYSSLYVLLYALVAPLGYTVAQLSVPKVFVGLCASEMAASLPISGIAGFGAYEGAWALVFGLLGFESIAEVTGVSHHLVTQVYGYGIGIAALLVLLLPFFNVKESRSLHVAGRSIVKRLAAAGVLSILVALGGAWWFSQRQGAKAPPDGALELSAAALATVLQGAVVYEHAGGIYRTTIGEASGRCLAEQGRYPRWSPDGSRIVFVRATDVVCMDSDGANARPIAGAEQPRAVAWHPNGNSVLFTDGDTIVSAALQGGARSVIAKGYDFRELDIAADGRHLITTVLHPTRLRAYDLETGEVRDLARGCSGSLSPDGERVSNNLGRHKTMAILAWKSGEQVAAISAPEGQRFDNQFWSNHPDWVASRTEGKHADIFIHRLSDNRAFLLTAYGDCDRPDLYISQ